MCPARAMALVGSEWMMRDRKLVISNHRRFSWIAEISASKAASILPMDLLPSSMGFPAPFASRVVTHPRPADVLREPSVQTQDPSYHGTMKIPPLAPKKSCLDSARSAIAPHCESALAIGVRRFTSE